MFELRRKALEAAYLAGFNASGEGYNADYPFAKYLRKPETNQAWCKQRDYTIDKVLKEIP